MSQTAPRFPTGSGLYAKFGKRLLDLALSSLALVALSPLMIALALGVRISFGPPIFFRQRRPGLHGRPFMLIKFRSMTNQRDSRGQVLPDDRRITPFGRLMRSMSLDELPELFNVLRGDMSLVGPRPLLMQYLGRYTPEQMRRHTVSPGLTGWAQINGRNALSWEEKFELDLWYVDNISLSLDLKILLITLLKLLRREGISMEGHATMPEFMGTPRLTDESR